MKKIGILGGLGPEATARLFNLIIELTPAKKDQDHIPIVILNNPQTPDRTAFIMEKGENPLPLMIKSAILLECNGADHILIPCNTAHHFISEIQAHTSVPILDMIAETSAFIQKNYPDIRRVGLISTTGTISSGLYHRELENQEITVIHPNDFIQENVVMDAIYGDEGIKAGYHARPRLQLIQAGKDLISKGAELIIAGCTEVSLVLEQKDVPYVVIDPLRILAEKAVELATRHPETEDKLKVIK